MAEDMTEISLDSLVRLQSAVSDSASAEAKRIVRAVIDDLRGRPGQGLFGEVAARHMWDEYCWSLQEGPLDDDMGWDDVRLGSPSGAFDDMVRAVIAGEIEKLPRLAQVILSAMAIEDDPDTEDDMLGSIWPDGMVGLILEGVNREASRRNLDLIGPDRGDLISYEVEGSGTVWSVLSDRGEAMDLVAAHSEAMIDPDGDLSELAAEMAAAFMVAFAEEVQDTIFVEVLEMYDNEIKTMLAEGHIVEMLEDMRAGLLERLDG